MPWLWRAVGLGLRGTSGVDEHTAVASRMGRSDVENSTGSLQRSRSTCAALRCALAARREEAEAGALAAAGGILAAGGGTNCASADAGLAELGNAWGADVASASASGATRSKSWGARHGEDDRLEQQRPESHPNDAETRRDALAGCGRVAVCGGLGGERGCECCVDARGRGLVPRASPVLLVGVGWSGVTAEIGAGEVDRGSREGTGRGCAAGAAVAAATAIAGGMLTICARAGELWRERRAAASEWSREL